MFFVSSCYPGIALEFQAKMSNWFEASKWVNSSAVMKAFIKASNAPEFHANLNEMSRL